MANNERVVGGIKTRLLHNKDYVEVAERVRIAHAVEDDFEMVEDHVVEIGGRLLWRSVIRVKGKTYMGHAEIKLDAPKNSPDGTNPFECAETSAIGRALAFAGLGTVESIASYDEVARSLPVVSVEPVRQRTVEAAPTRQIAAPDRALTWLDIYKAGKAKGLWSAANGFCAFVSAELGVNASEESVKSLPPEALKQLASAVESEKPVGLPV